MERLPHGKYTKDLRLEAVRLVTEGGVSVQEASMRLSLPKEDRHGLRSTLITSQVATDHWHELITNATIADAVCDRLIHNAYRITLKGESMRKTKARLT